MPGNRSGCSSGGETMHIKSPLTDAFRSELEYLNVAGRLLSKIYSTLHTVNDARFIAERLSIFNLQHELPKYLDRIRQIDVNMANFLQEEFLDLKYGSPDRPDDVDDFSLGLLVDRVKQRHEALLGRECVATSLRYLHISPLVPSLRADQHVRQAIGYVLDNLLSNAINYRSTKTKIKAYLQFGRAKQGPSKSFSGSHDPVPQTPLVFRHRRDLPICGKFTLIIEYVIGKRLDPETALALGVRPVFNEDNASYRLGLFIVGLIVRQLGGYIEPMEDNGTTVLQIRIPLVAAPT